MRLYSRRKLLQQTGVGIAGLLGTAAVPRLAAGMKMQSGAPRRARTIDASRLASFVDPLPLPELQKPLGRRSSAPHGAVNAPYYEVSIRATAHAFHRDLPPAKVWTYGKSGAPVLFEAASGQGTLIRWINDLPPQHFLPLDAPGHGMSAAPPTRVSTHMHGARVPSVSDGYPEDWFGPGHDRLCYYPNQQSATALWCHDHAMGVSRFNVFAGLMGWYLLRDTTETALGLPSGKYEIPLLLYDRSFDLQGQLYYPNPPDQGAWSQEFLGDAMVVNGKIRPYHEVEPRLYRLRIANTANSRFFSLSFSNGQGFQVVGSDQGLLASPVPMKRLVLAPAERADIVVDFSSAAGSNITLISDSLELLQFRVAQPAVQHRRERVPVALNHITRLRESEAERTRILTLNEFDNDNGTAMIMLLNRMRWADPVTERVRLHATEIWSLVNLTQDTHPIHLHEVRFQILDRRPISVEDYLASDPPSLQFTGPAQNAAPHEQGWKDVVQCPPGTVTRIIIPFEGYPGRYVWHCHLLEHEANEMMRPFEIVDKL